jgi:O-antigen/teichoic acid export membrane protein
MPDKTFRLTSYFSHLTSHAGFRRYFANTSWLFAEQILRMIAGFLVGVWIARYLGPEKYGIFSYALAFVSLFQGIAKLGLDGIVVRDIVKEPEKTNIYLGTAFWLKLAAGIFTFFLIHIISWFTADTLQTFLFINIIAAGIIFQSFEVIDFYYQATVQAKYISIRKIIQLVLSSLIKIYLVLIKADLIWFVWVTLFDAVSMAIFSLLVYKKQKQPEFLKSFDKNLAKKIIKDSFPLLLSSIAIMIYMRIDQVMIKNTLGDKEVGLYSAAVRLVEMWYFIPMIITSSLFPAIVNAKKVSEELYYHRLNLLFAFLIFVSLFISLFTVFYSKDIIRLIYSETYLESSSVLSILIWATIFASINVSTGRWIITENLEKLSFYRAILGAIMNVILNILLIPTMQIKGAALATVVSYAVAAYLYFFFNKATFKLAKHVTFSPYYVVYFFIKIGGKDNE